MTAQGVVVFLFANYFCYLHTQGLPHFGLSQLLFGMGQYTEACGLLLHLVLSIFFLMTTLWHITSVISLFVSAPIV